LVFKIVGFARAPQFKLLVEEAWAQRDLALSPSAGSPPASPHESPGRGDALDVARLRYVSELVASEDGLKASQGAKPKKILLF